MKCLSTKIALFFLAFILCFYPSHAQQQFKWVRGGGTSEDFSVDPGNEWERTEYMCTDPNGNVYALSQVGENAIYADTFIRLSGCVGNQNVLITSYNCSGQMRWAKLITSNAGPCLAAGIVSDNLGNIYVTGSFTNATLYIGNDTTITGLANESTGVIQFDTTGHFNWIQYVGDNTASTYYASSPSALVLDGVNNVHMLTYMGHGLHITPTETSIYGTYDMVYNTTGTLLSAVRLDLDSQWYLNGAAIDPLTNKLYTSGQINQTIFGGFLTDTFFAAAFDASRNLLWQYFCGHGDDDGIDGLALDQSKYIYFCGNAQPPISGGGPSVAFSFNGDSVTAPGFFEMSIIMKTDTNGKVDWIKHYDGTSNNAFLGLTLMPNNMLGAAGYYYEKVIKGTDTINAGVGVDPFFAIVDSSGNSFILKGIHGDGYNDMANAIVSDNVGNLFIGGEVADSIPDGIIPAYHTVGGNTDFFVMKYGVDCSCTSGPTAAYTDTGTHHTIGVTYTGTTTGLDSVVWSYGDGTTSTGTTGTHAYSAAGTYEVCVTTYTDCGVDEHCGSFVVDSPTHVSIAPSGSPRGGVTVFPNPARDELTIEAPSGSPQGGAVLINNMMGQEVYSGVMSGKKLVVNISGLTSGVYILELVGLDGERDIVRVVKE